MRCSSHRSTPWRSNNATRLSKIYSQKPWRAFGWYCFTHLIVIDKKKYWNRMKTGCYSMFTWCISYLNTLYNEFRLPVFFPIIFENINNLVSSVVFRDGIDSGVIVRSYWTTWHPNTYRHHIAIEWICRCTTIAPQSIHTHFGWYRMQPTSYTNKYIFSGTKPFWCKKGQIFDKNLFHTL